ncbi:uncharacterized protein LOC122922501 isoform X1 [Bufo gargarizans]|uniref:uncharacterized protein LOC122922501 isoform X1 n=1 Tax=Bufo gargarizans TaxID=30331 RepID=UPI001CF1F7EB|nr:uncharacterized protein LOC122922501 isoform X1 [Bufo gargarizans]
MEPSDKRIKEWLRLSDGFRRADMRIICPVMKAENSICVLYKLQQEKLTEAITSAGKSHGLILENIQYVSQTTSRGAESSLFIKFRNPLPNDENLCSKFKERLERNLSSTMVKDILVERVQDASQSIPQPLVSEYDFEMHKLKLCLAELDGKKEEFPRRLDLSIEGENIKLNLEDLSNSYTKFAMLSHNGRGKSYLLNLLLLMTADNEEEYSASNRNLRVPNDFPNNTLVKNLTDRDLQNLPVVVNKFLNIQDNTQFKDQDFKCLMGTICVQQQNITNAETALRGLSDIDEYFTKKKRLNLEPYFLSQKGNQGGHESTTKCIIRLRYGTLYEMKVEYFSKSELQEQLYELVITEEGSSSCSDEEVNETAQECLTERFQILTGHSFSENMKDTFNCPKDIKFSPEVLEFVGKTELYFGQGKNPTHDRLALQNILKGLTIPQDSAADANDEIYKKRIAAVKEIVVYLPCKILYGGKEILEMPGTDDSDPIAMDFIANALNEVDALILLTENGLKVCEKEVKTMFSKSGFLKNFKKQPDKHTVLLLTYPEKNTDWQYASGDEKRIKLLESEGNKKRNVELKAMKKILNLDTLTKSLEERICTSYILPVLHTSILAQEHKPEYEVISRHQDTFLKYTGIQELIMNLDELVFSRQKSFEETKQELFRFHAEINDVISVEDARYIVQTLSVRSCRDPIESGIKSRFDILKKELSQKMYDVLSGDVSRMIKTELTELVPKAIDRWDQIEPEVISIGVFSPYFCGKNPRYHICLYHVLFEGLENSKNQIIEKILDMVQGLLQNLKKRAIKQYTDELNTILHDIGRPNAVTIDFVEDAIGDELDDALKWYQGKKQRPFNEKTMEKFWDDSQKQSLKDAILTPNFKKCTMEEAKIKTRKNIKKCIMDVEENFINRVKRLHLQRFKSLSSKLWNRNGTPKIWKQLINHLRALSGEEHNYRGNINILKMIEASFI